MDIELARTFITVAESGSFVKAAERLYLTQSTVSTRIKVLEGQLGRSLFNRSKSGVTMTAAGNQFLRHATALLRVWQQARQEIALPADYQQLLSVGAQFSLWDGVMLHWLGRMRKNHSEIAIRAETGSNDQLMRQVIDGLLDVAILYTPQARAGLRIERLLEENLVMVSTKRGRRNFDPNQYVFVDWGPEFEANHAIACPEAAAWGLYVGMGSLGLEYILSNGGTGYFPIRLVKALIDEGRMHLVPKAPKFRRLAFAIYYPDEENAALAKALAIMRAVASETDRVGRKALAGANLPEGS